MFSNLFFITGEVHYSTHGFNFVYTSYNVNETTYAIFKLKGPASSGVALVSDKSTDFTSGSYYLFSIGAWGNSYCALQKGRVGGILSFFGDQSNTGYLSNLEYRTFWISWAGHNKSLGHGTKVGNGVIFSYNDTATPLTISHLAFGSYGQYTNQHKYYNGKNT